MTLPIVKTLEVSDFQKVSEEARFATAVAAFGQVLKDDPFVRGFPYDEIVNMANAARGKDEFGYRAEFVSLVRLAKTARAME